LNNSGFFCTGSVNCPSVMSQISFFSPVRFTNPTCSQKILECVDDYFCLGGRKAQVFSQGSGVEHVMWVDAPSSRIFNAIKVSSYATGIIPLVVLLMKWISRKPHRFVLADGNRIADVVKRSLQRYIAVRKVQQRRVERHLQTFLEHGRIRTEDGLREIRGIVDQGVSWLATAKQQQRVALARIDLRVVSEIVLAVGVDVEGRCKVASRSEVQKIEWMRPLGPEYDQKIRLYGSLQELSMSGHPTASRPIHELVSGAEIMRCIRPLPAGGRLIGARLQVCVWDDAFDRKVVARSPEFLTNELAASIPDSVMHQLRS
jgi:hypothetical protein